MRDAIQSLVDFLIESEQNVRAYSGRGMYGKSCVGIVTDDLGEAVACVMDWAIEQVNDSSESPEHLDTLRQRLRSMSTDSMGRDMIVYFPRLSSEGIVFGCHAEDEE